MAATTNQVATAALGLPARSRALLAGKLLASLAGKIDPTVERGHLEEVRRRREAVRSGKAGLIDGEEGLRRARAALQQ